MLLKANTSKYIPTANPYTLAITQKDITAITFLIDKLILYLCHLITYKIYYT
ncbi:hypothetical protein M2132_000313 [Dysgonomonas sp. PH5-45]|nr:hypothetical protein [Dysgonomonas sp. PH5-45]MDH6386895.1 hypothetical protein [Dysgonomonas sp. PH5-37]